MNEVVIYKGATRPAMKWGVPMMPLLILCLGGMSIAGWAMIFTQKLWIGAVVGAFVFTALMTMRAITRKDDQRLSQIARLLVLLWRHWRSMLLWRCRSYSPVCYHGTDHAWRP
jgi:type IV secretion system protein VirB3